MYTVKMAKMSREETDNIIVCDIYTYKANTHKDAERCVYKINALHKHRFV